jgi:hypothetical protein
MQITAGPYKENTNLHMFSRAVIQDGYGTIEGAIILTDIARNIRNIKPYRKNKKDYERLDGWYAITIKELVKRHPYIAPRTIRRILAKYRKDKTLNATKRFNKRKSNQTLWYSFGDEDLRKECLAPEDAISFFVQDAVECGIEAAIVLRNLKWHAENSAWEHVLDTTKWAAVNPVEFLENTDLPLTAQKIRRALQELVKKGKLERKRQAAYGNTPYLYRLVDSHHLQPYEERDGEPTESYQHGETDQMPTEYYDHLGPVPKAQRKHDSGDQLLKELERVVQKVKASHRPSPKI